MTRAGSLGQGQASVTLVVEDDQAVAVMLCYLLEDVGYRCISARTAEEGRAVAATQALEAAIIDIRLPGRDGWWLVRQLRAEPVGARLPVVMITGFMDASVEEQSQELGTIWLAKPFTLDDLVDRLVQARGLAARLGPRSTQY